MNIQSIYKHFFQSEKGSAGPIPPALLDYIPYLATFAFPALTPTIFLSPAISAWVMGREIKEKFLGRIKQVDTSQIVKRSVLLFIPFWSKGVMLINLAVDIYLLSQKKSSVDLPSSVRQKSKDLGSKKNKEIISLKPEGLNAQDSNTSPASPSKNAKVTPEDLIQAWMEVIDPKELSKRPEDRKTIFLLFLKTWPELAEITYLSGTQLQKIPKDWLNKLDPLLRVQLLARLTDLQRPKENDPNITTTPRVDRDKNTVTIDSYSLLDHLIFSPEGSPEAIERKKKNFFQLLEEQPRVVSEKAPLIAEKIPQEWLEELLCTNPFAFFSVIITPLISDLTSVYPFSSDELKKFQKTYKAFLKKYQWRSYSLNFVQPRRKNPTTTQLLIPKKGARVKKPQSQENSIQNKQVVTKEVLIQFLQSIGKSASELPNEGQGPEEYFLAVKKETKCDNKSPY